MPGYTRVADIADLPPGAMLRVEVEGQALVLANVEGSVHAFAARCTHAGGALDRGSLQDHVVVCPRHGSRFDIRDGQVVRGPARQPIATFAVRLTGSNVEVQIP